MRHWSYYVSMLKYCKYNKMQDHLFSENNHYPYQVDEITLAWCSALLLYVESSARTCLDVCALSWCFLWESVWFRVCHRTPAMEMLSWRTGVIDAEPLGLRGRITGGSGNICESVVTCKIHPVYKDDIVCGRGKRVFFWIICNQKKNWEWYQKSFPVQV